MVVYFVDKKQHRNGIKRPKSQRYPSLKGVSFLPFHISESDGDWWTYCIAGTASGQLNGPYSTKIVGRVLISLSTLWARRWINHWSLWRMASLTSDLRLPSQPQVPDWCQIIHCLVTEACEQLAQGCYLKWEWPGVEPVTFCVVSQHPKHLHHQAIWLRTVILVLWWLQRQCYYMFA